MCEIVACYWLGEWFGYATLSDRVELTRSHTRQSVGVPRSGETRLLRSDCRSRSNDRLPAIANLRIRLDNLFGLNSFAMRVPHAS